MKTENVLYTDGHDVTVTESAIHVKKKWYNISGITKHNFTILQPDRLPAGILLVLGTLLEIAGAASFIPFTWIPDVYLFSTWVNANVMAMSFGILFLVVGAVWMLLTHERYAVSITTAEGEKNVVISKSKEYIMQIIRALNEAFFARIPHPTKEMKRDFLVSGR